MPAALAIVTTGPASAPIDAVRAITNTASGETGALLAGALAAAGFECLVFRGRGATHPAPAGIPVRPFSTNHELADALHAVAQTRGAAVRAVFHAAALSDYAVASVRGPHGPLPSAGKIPGDLDRLEIVLEQSAKILPRLRGWFPGALIVAWKYELDGTRDDAIAAGRGQLATGRADLSVVNGRAYGPGSGVLEGENPPVHHADKRGLAQYLASRAAASGKAHE